MEADCHLSCVSLFTLVESHEYINSHHLFIKQLLHSVYFCEAQAVIKLLL